MTTDQPSITCPVCNMTSYNPNDIREGYCGNCNKWTTQVCYFHGVEPIPADAYRVCAECGHCYNTREDLVSEDVKLRRWGLDIPLPDPADEIYTCPLCLHDF